MLFVNCGGHDCEARETSSSDMDTFRARLASRGWMDIYADRDNTNHGNGWRCPECIPQNGDSHEYAEYALMNLSSGNGLLVLPRTMSAADWIDLDERLKAIRVLHG